MPNQEDRALNSATKPSGPMLSYPEILAKIKQLLAEHLKPDDELFRSLCAFAMALKLDAEEFRVLLKEAGMRAPRASEIKTVLLQPKICARFLQKENPESWKRTLQNARDAGPKALDRLGMRLVHLLLEVEEDWLDGQEYQDWKLNRDNRGQYSLAHKTLGTLELKDC